MNLLPIYMFIGISDMLRPILSLDLEERLGRKLTDMEWRYYLQEIYRKREAERVQKIIRQWCQQLLDRKIIHDFVWREN